jgi:hypothetical protein
LLFIERHTHCRRDYWLFICGCKSASKWSGGPTGWVACGCLH